MPQKQVKQVSGKNTSTFPELFRPPDKFQFYYTIFGFQLTALVVLSVVFRSAETVQDTVRREMDREK